LVYVGAELTRVSRIDRTLVALFFRLIEDIGKAERAEVSGGSCSKDHGQLAAALAEHLEI